jgi:hypothetical protein
MTYRSKKDWWLVLLILPIMSGMVVGGIVLVSLALIQAVPLPFVAEGLALTAIGAMVLWAFFTTSCEITPSDLMVRFGPLRWRIPLEAIVDAVPKKGISSELAWGLAWSLDRVVVKYRRRSGRKAWLGLAVSPEDKEKFLEELAQAVADAQGWNKPEPLPGAS